MSSLVTAGEKSEDGGPPLEVFEKNIGMNIEEEKQIDSRRDRIQRLLEWHYRLDDQVAIVDDTEASLVTEYVKLVRMCPAKNVDWCSGTINNGLIITSSPLCDIQLYVHEPAYVESDTPNPRSPGTGRHDESRRDQTAEAIVEIVDPIVLDSTGGNINLPVDISPVAVNAIVSKVACETRCSALQRNVNQISREVMRTLECQGTARDAGAIADAVTDAVTDNLLTVNAGGDDPYSPNEQRLASMEARIRALQQEILSVAEENVRMQLKGTCKETANIENDRLMEIDEYQKEIEEIEELMRREMFYLKAAKAAEEKAKREARRAKKKKKKRALIAKNECPVPAKEEQKLIKSIVKGSKAIFVLDEEAAKVPTKAPTKVEQPRVSRCRAKAKKPLNPYEEAKKKAQAVAEARRAYAPMSRSTSRKRDESKKVGNEAGKTPPTVMIPEQHLLDVEFTRNLFQSPKAQVQPKETAQVEEVVKVAVENAKEAIIEAKEIRKIVDNKTKPKKKAPCKPPAKSSKWDKSGRKVEEPEGYCYLPGRQDPAWLAQAHRINAAYLEEMRLKMEAKEKGKSKAEIAKIRVLPEIVTPLPPAEAVTEQIEQAVDETIRSQAVKEEAVAAAGQEPLDEAIEDVQCPLLLDDYAEPEEECLIFPPNLTIDPEGCEIQDQLKRFDELDDQQQLFRDTISYLRRKNQAVLNGYNAFLRDTFNTIESKFVMANINLGGLSNQIVEYRNTGDRLRDDLNEKAAKVESDLGKVEEPITNLGNILTARYYATDERTEKFTHGTHDILEWLKYALLLDPDIPADGAARILADEAESVDDILRSYAGYTRLVRPRAYIPEEYYPIGGELTEEVVGPDLGRLLQVIKALEARIKCVNMGRADRRAKLEKRLKRVQALMQGLVATGKVPEKFSEQYMTYQREIEVGLLDHMPINMQALSDIQRQIEFAAANLADVGPLLNDEERAAIEARLAGINQKFMDIQPENLIDAEQPVALNELDQLPIQPDEMRIEGEYLFHVVPTDEHAMHYVELLIIDAQLDTRRAYETLDYNNVYHKMLIDVTEDALVEAMDNADVLFNAHLNDKHFPFDQFVNYVKGNVLTRIREMRFNQMELLRQGRGEEAAPILGPKVEDDYILPVEPLGPMDLYPPEAVGPKLQEGAPLYERPIGPKTVQQLRAQMRLPYRPRQITLAQVLAARRMAGASGPVHRLDMEWTRNQRRVVELERALLEEQDNDQNYADEELEPELLARAQEVKAAKTARANRPKRAAVPPTGSRRFAHIQSRINTFRRPENVAAQPTPPPAPPQPPVRQLKVPTIQYAVSHSAQFPAGMPHEDRIYVALTMSTIFKKLFAESGTVIFTLLDWFSRNNAERAAEGQNRQPNEGPAP